MGQCAQLRVVEECVGLTYVFRADMIERPAARHEV